MNFQHFATPLPCQYRAAVLICAENGQPIVVTAHSHCAEDMQRYVGEGWVKVDFEVKHNF